MAKIKVIEKSEEIEGDIIEGKVTPFGTSGHISFPKRFIGRKVKVIVPDSEELFWIFDEKLREKLIRLSKKSAFKNTKKDTHYFLGCIENFSQKEFDLDSLVKVLYLLENNKSLESELLLIKKAYGIQ